MSYRHYILGRHKVKKYFVPAGRCFSCRMPTYTGESGHCYRCIILPSCRRCKKHRQPSRMDGSVCSFCRRRANWVVERKDAKRSLKGIFAISTIRADHDDDSDEAVDLDTFLLRRRRNIESALRHALENQK